MAAVEFHGTPASAPVPEDHLGDQVLTHELCHRLRILPALRATSSPFTPLLNLNRLLR
jgi:hypothetical protein